LEWELPAGRMHPRTLILTAALFTRSGRGGVAGDVAGAGDVAWDGDVAGVGLHLTGTRGGKTTK